jgi:branched-chain amino acid transport system ATP-binding protein
MADSLIEARGLNTYYGASHVLRDVDFRVARGEAVGLMGRNGMGKTTLIKSLLGLLPVRAGEILINGKPMRNAPPYRIARAGIGYVPEGRGIFPTLSVIENLQMAARAGAGGRRAGARSAGR